MPRVFLCLLTYDQTRLPRLFVLLFLCFKRFSHGNRRVSSIIVQKRLRGHRPAVFPSFSFFFGVLHRSQVEATKFTEVGFHGQDVDKIIKDLVEVSSCRSCF